MRVFLPKVISSVVLLTAISHSVSAESIYGFYTNMHSDNGEVSGIEVFLMNDGRPGKCNMSAIVQIAEGFPQYPEILDCCGCTSRNVTFDSKKIGTFQGSIQSGVLVGEFVSLKYKVSLNKGLSYWQGH